MPGGQDAQGLRCSLQGVGCLPVILVAKPGCVLHVAYGAAASLGSPVLPGATCMCSASAPAADRIAFCGTAAAAAARAAAPGAGATAAAPCAVAAAAVAALTSEATRALFSLGAGCSCKQ